MGFGRSGIGGLRVRGVIPSPGGPLVEKGPALPPRPLPHPRLPARRRGVRWWGALLGHGLACSALPGRGVSNLPVVP